jgi:hypothetical protein
MRSSSKAVMGSDWMRWKSFERYRWFRSCERRRVQWKSNRPRSPPDRVKPTLASFSVRVAVSWPWATLASALSRSRRVVPNTPKTSISPSRRHDARRAMVSGEASPSQATQGWTKAG